MNTRILVLLASAACTSSAFAQASDDPADLIKSYAALKLDEKAKARRLEVVFDDASKDRICLEHRLVACGKAAVKPLMAALESDNPHVRAMAAELLGVIGDKTAVSALEAAAKGTDATTRICSLQSLAWLKAGKDLLVEAGRDANPNVAFIGKRALEQFAAASRVRDSFSEIDRKEMDTATVGERAPDFALATAGAKTWRLSDQRGTVILLFQLADW